MAEIEWKTKEEINNEKSQPSELEIIKKQQADLIFSLMMNGVL
jgi:hypothetical protein